MKGEPMRGPRLSNVADGLSELSSGMENSGSRQSRSPIRRPVPI